MDFLFLSGEVTLDFVNTRPMVKDSPLELLAEDADVFRWMVEAGLITHHDAKGARTSVHGVAAPARTLREALRQILQSLLAGHPPPHASIETLNDLLCRTSGPTVLEFSRNHFTLRADYQPRSTRAALTPIARAAARFLTELDVTLLRRCENPECVLYFYDTSKNHGRRWCSMKSCGNRAKVAEYRRRASAT